MIAVPTMTKPHRNVSGAILIVLNVKVLQILSVQSVLQELMYSHSLEFVLLVQVIARSVLRTIKVV